MAAEGTAAAASSNAGSAGSVLVPKRLAISRFLRQFAARYLADGAGPTMALKVCQFTNSPDEHFIIDVLPTYHRSQ